MLAQIPACLHPICGTAHRGRGASPNELLAAPTPCAPPSSTGRTGRTGEVRRVCPSTWPRKARIVRVYAEAWAAEQRRIAPQGMAHRGVLSLVPFFAQAKKGTCCRQPRRPVMKTADPCTIVNKTKSPLPPLINGNLMGIAAPSTSQNRQMSSGGWGCLLIN